jgi:hypothetical protein
MIGRRVRDFLRMIAMSGRTSVRTVGAMNLAPGRARHRSRSSPHRDGFVDETRQPLEVPGVDDAAIVGLDAGSGP